MMKDRSRFMARYLFFIGTILLFTGLFMIKWGGSEKGLVYIYGGGAMLIIVFIWYAIRYFKFNEHHF